MSRIKLIEAKKYIMDLSQRKQCMDLALYSDFGKDYPYQITLDDLAFVMNEIIYILQQLNLTEEDLLQLEKEYNKRYDSKTIHKQTNEITW